MKDEVNFKSEISNLEFYSSFILHPSSLFFTLLPFASFFCFFLLTGFSAFKYGGR
jgi:hypothetical protein